MNKNKLFFNSILSLIVAVICLFIFIKSSEGNLDFKYILISLYDGWVYLIIASTLLILSVYIRSLRWKYLFQSNISNNMIDLFSSQLVGYFINNIFPIRIGDFAKSYIVAKKTNNKTSYILGSIIMERVLDTLMLLIFMIIIVWYYGANYLNIDFSLLSIPIYIIVIILIGIIFIIYYCFVLIPSKIKNILNEIWAGFIGINSSSKSIVIFSSVLIWSIYWINVFLIQMIFPSVDLSFMQCLLILVVSSSVQLIPTGFGALGVFHLGVKSVLDGLGVLNYENFLMMLWLYSYFIYTILGSYFFCKEGRFTFKNLYNDWIKNY